MAFAIMRFAKLKTGAPISGAVSHIARARETPNADPARRHLNRALVGSDNAATIRRSIEARTPAKFRRDAVRALEFVITASPELFVENAAQTGAFFDSAVEWLQEQFGPENVVSAVVHYDESAPHMHAIVVPVDADTGRLNAKRWVGGRGLLRRMQTSFAEHQARFGVERGRSRAETGRDHTTIQEWQRGHAQLDERETALADRERAVGGHQQELGERETALADRERAVGGHQQELDERETALADRERAVGGHQQELDERETALADRERAVGGHQQELDERAQRLAALERALTERGEKLQGGEIALEQRQQQIEAAGEKLQARLDAARERQQAWERQRDAWLAENRPPEVPAILGHLRHLGSLSAHEAADYLDEQDSDELYRLFDPQRGPTARGKALLDQYAGAAERRERWEQTVEPPSGPGF